MRRPTKHQHAEHAVDRTIAEVGRKIVLAVPLGLGKPNRIVNAFYRRAVADRSIQLRIITALTLERPSWTSPLEQRLVEPLGERIFGDWVDLEYASDRAREVLPPNVEIVEFYLQPARFLNNGQAQQSYISTDYTHVARDIIDAGVNVIGQLISTSDNEEDAGTLSLSSNPDVTLDLVSFVERARARGEDIRVLGEVNRRLPFMYGPAQVDEALFDHIVDDAGKGYTLFGPPNPRISTTDYMIGLHASSLIRDGGTLQLGIGSLGDAITYLLTLRHEHTQVYNDLIDHFGVREKFGRTVTEWGGTTPFEHGLYGSTEMLVDGFIDLYNAGILKRRVYDDLHIQRAVSQGLLQDRPSAETIENLIGRGMIPAKIDEATLEQLRKLGVVLTEVRFDGEWVVSPDGRLVNPNLGNPDAREAFAATCLTEELPGGVVTHAGFFLGPTSFYESLNNMDPTDRRRIAMSAVSYTNSLHGPEELKRLQRVDARFINSALMVTLMGAVVSDGLADGRVLSGVGGQMNFVSMAHELEGARSIIMVRSTRELDGDLQSNLVWNYGHNTIPRQLRDVVITEYGIADLRGKTDSEVVGALLNIADSRFQAELLEQAKQAGKLPKDYEIPKAHRDNFPEKLKSAVARYRTKGLFPYFPQGTDLTDEEIVLMRALKALKQVVGNPLSVTQDLGALTSTVMVPPEAKRYLDRMGLQAPSTPSQWLQQRAVVYALGLIDAI